MTALNKSILDEFKVIGYQNFKQKYPLLTRWRVLYARKTGYHISDFISVLNRSLFKYDKSKQLVLTKRSLDNAM